MSPHRPLTPKAWFSAAELAEMGLPGVATSKFGVQKVAQREGWADRTGHAGEPLARKRQGRGGGVEYHMSLLPDAAKARLLAARPAAAERMDRDSAWMRWERLPESMKAEARERLAVIERVEDLRRHGLTKDRAVHEVARSSGRGVSTIYAWFDRILGVRSDDRAVYLTPDYAGRTTTAACPQEAWEHYKGYYLRQSEPTAESAYRDLMRVAGEKGWTIPSAKTLQRRLDAEIPPNVQTFLRKGPKALDHTFPHLQRDRSMITPMMIGNLDGHLWDVVVEWEDGTRGRPHSLAVQDIASSKVLAVRFDRTLNANLVRLALGDTFRDHGLFETLLMDNGRENNAAQIAGGQPINRRWHKVPEETPDGVLKLLNIKAVFVTPYWGQAKPIERMFRDWAHDIAKRPEFEGAYTGHNTVAKPENSRTRAIPIAEFEAIIKRELLFYNAQQARRGAHLNGRSFDQVFAEGVARHPVRTASPEQLRLCLLASKPVSMDRQSGAVSVEGHRYFSPELAAIKRQRVVVRFDPENLAAAAYVYSLDGRLLAHATRIGAGNFNSVTTARNHRAALRDHSRAVRAQADALRRMTAAEVAEASAAAPTPGAPSLDPKVIAPDFSAPRHAEDFGQARRMAVGAGSTLDFNAAFERGVAAMDRSG
ncbi:MAG TPA: transposase domain-containing protein [Caulobacteraceae bacterium]|nr:transposase domain-containing protein [Caulobacteraceae bacterium]